MATELEAVPQSGIGNSFSQRGHPLLCVKLSSLLGQFDCLLDYTHLLSPPFVSYKLQDNLFQSGNGGPESLEAFLTKAPFQREVNNCLLEECT